MTPKAENSKISCPECIFGIYPAELLGA